MENEIKQMIIDALDDVDDVGLLDLVWKMLILGAQEKQNTDEAARRV